MSIQTVPGSEMISTGSSAIKADFSQFSRAFSAASDAGASLSNVAKVVGDYGIQRQEIKNKIQAGKDAGIIAEASDAMSKSKHEFEQGLKNDPDSEKWGEKWHETYQKQKNEFLSSDRISPNLKKQLSIGFDHWGRAGAIDVDTVANKHQIGRATKSIENAMDEHAKAGTPESMQAIDNLGRMMKDRGLAFPEDVDALVKNKKTASELYAVHHAIQNDAATAVRLLDDPDNFKMLDPTQRDALYVHARAVKSKNQTEYSGDLISRLYDVPGTAFSKESLAQYVQNDKITGRQALQIERAQAGTHKERSKDVFDIVKAQIDVADFSKLSSPEQFISEAKTAVLNCSPADRATIDKAIESKRNEFAAGKIKKSESAFRSEQKEIELLFSAGRLMPASEEMKKVSEPSWWDSSREVKVGTGRADPETQWKSISEWESNDPKSDKLRMARARMARVVDSFGKYHIDHPDASPEELRKVREDLTRPLIVQQIKDFLNPKPAAMQRVVPKDLVDKITSGGQGGGHKKGT